MRKAHSSSGLGRRPLTAEITGSNPVCATTKSRSLIIDERLLLCLIITVYLEHLSVSIIRQALRLPLATAVERGRGVMPP